MTTTMITVILTMLPAHDEVGKCSNTDCSSRMDVVPLIHSLISILNPLIHLFDCLKKCCAANTPVYSHSAVLHDDTAHTL